eukprot:9664484-Ditylum_brightwellii.AAC.1
MGEQLNYKGNQASCVTQYKQVPDENMGRESMQLYSTGLHKLNRDGTPLRDANGRLQKVYKNYHVVAIQDYLLVFDHALSSRVDPMVLGINSHDLSPKRDLNDGWVGDRYPLCVDLPPKHFLKKGATYTLLGSQSTPRLQWVDGRSNHLGASGNWEGNNNVKRLSLQKGGQLYNALCAALTEGGDCTYPSAITLDESLTCDPNADP